ncbi:MAG: hypothetical protein IK002_02840 [Treponema sp.]|uniref:hypothetical protein n=1 Tax=Treponema sp. TaxID=166 RepID=UPI00298DA14F|nr:hypothetical protein [Treponema sp.]MBR5932903.1 hypothetical protein [Treponema sp.]
MNKKILSFIAMLFISQFLFGVKSMEQSTIEKMRQLKKGTTYSEVVSLFGEPDEELGSGLLIVGYNFSESQIVLHFFTGESLQGLWEIKSNGEKIIYIPLQLDEQ